MRLHLSIALLVSTTQLFGCGKFFSQFSRQTNGTTAVQFGRSAASALQGRAYAPQAGGIMVYAMNTAGGTLSLSLANDLDPTVFQLPNGVYNFKAVGWPHPNFGGPPTCGYNDNGPVALQGTSTVVNISLFSALDANSPCGNNDFGITQPLQFVFCDDLVASAAAGLGFTIAGGCSGGYESMRFFAGRSTGGSGASDINGNNVNIKLNSAGQSQIASVYYLADEFEPNVSAGQNAYDEFFTKSLVPGLSSSNAPPTLRLNLPGSRNTGPVTAGAFVPRTDYAIYSQQTGLIGGVTPIIQLFLTAPSLGLRGLKINGTLAANTSGIKSFAAGTDPSGNQWVVYSAESAVVGQTLLYSAQLNGLNASSTNVNVNQIGPSFNGSCTPATCPGVYSAVAGLEAQNAIQFTPDNSAIVFAYSSSPNIMDLWSSAPGGENLKQLSTDIAGLVSPTINWLGISPDSLFAVWSGNFGDPYTNASDTMPRVYRSLIGSAASEIVLSGSPLAQGVQSEPVLAPNSDIAVFSSDNTTASSQDLYIVDYSATTAPPNPLPPVKVLGGTNGAALVYDQILFTSSASGPAPAQTLSANFAFLSNNTSGNTNHLFLANYIGSGTVSATAADLNLLSGGILANFLLPAVAQNNGTMPYQFSADGASFYFDGPLTGNEVLPWLVTNLTNVNPTLAQLSAPPTNFASAMGAGFGMAFFTFAPTTGAPTGLPYLYNPALPGQFTQLFAGATLANVTQMNGPGNSQVIPIGSHPLEVHGQSITNGPNELYFSLDALANPASLTKASHLYEGASGSGMYRVRLLAYNQDPNGNFTPNPAGDIASACMNGSNSNGAPTPSPISGSLANFWLPPGSSAPSSPFALALDIFPEAYNCNGPMQTIMLKNGLASANTSTAGAALAGEVMKVPNTSAPVSTVLFLGD